MMKLRWKYRRLRWHLHVGPHWWIKPTWDATQPRHPRIQGITFTGPVELPAGAQVSHCAFLPASK